LLYAACHTWENLSPTGVALALPVVSPDLGHQSIRRRCRQDTWTLLILRDAFRGTRRFDDFHASLGMARSVLTARLRKLTEEGILKRRSYSDHPPRYEYLLTEKGRALFPVITALLTWGDTWAPGPGGPPVVLVHDTCGNVTSRC
jgi:DNA-binding HxlR family transcriptional regulator